MNVSQCSISLTNPYIRSGHLSNGILIIFYCNLLQNYRPSYTTSTKPSLLSYLSNYYIWKQSEACQRQNSETNTILYQNLTAQNRTKKNIIIQLLPFSVIRLHYIIILRSRSISYRSEILISFQPLIRH